MNKDSLRTTTSDQNLPYLRSLSMQNIESSLPVDLTKVYRCFWCTERIQDGVPVGCPLSIKRNHKVTLNKDNELAYNLTTELPCEPEFLTEHLFCSFNCCKAFINLNHDKPKYKDSTRLLHLMYLYSHDQPGSILRKTDIIPAPCKSLMVEYGGHLTSAQYRNTFCKDLYEDIGLLSMGNLTRLSIKRSDK